MKLRKNSSYEIIDDALDYKPYKNIIIEQWNTVGKAKVFYVSNRVMKFKKIFNYAVIVNKFS